MATIKETEQKRMDAVVAKIKEAQVKEGKTVAKVEADSKTIKDDFSKNVRLKTSTYSGMMETALTVRQQQQLLQERESNLNQAKRRLETLERLEHKPYFARIDFTEEGESKEVAYIGLGTFSDGPDNFLVYDWRAPISSIYYDGQGLGEVTYLTPDGERKVNLELKRQFMVEDGQILTVFDTDETLGDQMLLEVLGEDSDIKMKSIVTTIQREQNKIIRDTKSDLLFVQGAAGSGKTSAVLQRVAYLLYQYRGKLKSSQVILFSPNQLFNDYIDQVLPEMGEHNMVQMTFYQYSQRRVPNLRVETLQERFEKVEAPATKKIQKLKDSLEFFKATTRYARSLETQGLRVRPIKLNGEVFFSKETIKDIYYSFNENYHLKVRLSATREALIKKLNKRINKAARSERVQEAIQGLSKQQLDQLYGDHSRNFKSGDAEMDFLGRQFVMREFSTVHKKIIKNQFLSPRMQYLAFLKAVPRLVNLAKYEVSLAEWQAHVEAVKADFKEKKVSLGDVTAFLYLFDLVCGRRGETEMRHVFVDEIQDYTAYQLAYLKFSFPNAKFTLLGDLNQAIFTGENSHSLLKELGTMFDKEKTSVVQLTKSYRSTQQITDFTKEVLINGEAVTAFERAGEKPVIFQTDSQAAMLSKAVQQLAANDQEKLTTAIIGKTLAECEAITAELKAQGQEVTLIRTENQRLVPGTLVVPSYLAKGLEFDAIIMWDANAQNYGDDSQRQLVYTICSRAMHRLTILCHGQLSPLFANVNPDHYQLSE